MPDTIQSAQNPGTPERRLHPRKQLLFPWIKLGVDNGGIILDISEGGLAMQAVRSLADGELPVMRFQLSESQTWIETPGRIAWIGASKHTAGVEFVGLSEEARNQIRRWIPLPLHPRESAEENPLDEQIEPAKNALPTREPGSPVFVPESEMAERVDEHQNPHSIAEVPTGVLAGTAETQDTETVTPHIPDNSANPATTQNARRETSPTLCLSYQKTTSSREARDSGRTTGSRKSSRPIEFTLTTAVLLVSALFLLGYRFQGTGISSQGTEVRAAAKAADSSNSSANPTGPSVHGKVPLDQPTFVLQVGAMTHEKYAIALAESLHQKNFPAFVSQHENDRFYRVFVGPFSDVDSTLKIKEQLKNQGFEAFLTPWNPSAP
jgi:cell division protein FtsN